MRPSFQYALLLCLGLVTAAPIVERDVTSPQLASLSFFSQYAGASYCYGNVHGTGKKLSCSRESGACPSVESAQTSILQGFTLGGTNTSGFVALDNTNKLIVISIQGTANIEDLETDLDFPRVKTSLCGTFNTNDGCEIHQGFWNALLDVQVAVKANVVNALKAHPGYNVVATGHSLGGAVGALVGTSLRNAGISVDIYTYGQPKLGTVDISNYIQNQAPSKGSNYRVTHYNDLVPSLPPHLVDNWDHYYPEYWISTEDGTSPKTTDIEQVNAVLYALDGNEKAVAITDGVGLFVGELAANADALIAHLDYFGGISTCSSDPPGS